MSLRHRKKVEIESAIIVLFKNDLDHDLRYSQTYKICAVKDISYMYVKSEVCVAQA